MEVSNNNSWVELLRKESDTFIINLNNQEIEGVYELILLPEISFFIRSSKKKKTSVIR